jgi:cyclophilin family peptidyl-prolyl cis-trans isomerase
MQILWNWLRHFFANRPALAPIPVCSHRRGIEPLETRTLLAAGPQIIDVVADNRGQVVLTVDAKLDRKSVTNKSVQITADGERQKVKVKYTPKTRQITVAANVESDTSYTIRLLSKRIKDTKGNRLDGEFRRAGKPSGNGKAGGDFIATTRPADETVVRFSTIYGNMDVELFDEQTPLTVANFQRYADEGLWDNTIFHRSVANFVIQGGGYTLDAKKNTVDQVNQYPAVKNEPHPGNPGNVRGTIAMAKLGDDPNSATSQWFFNLGDNRANLDNQNGGFTAFGRITDNAGLKVMEKLAKRERVNVGGAFSELPVKNLKRVMERQQVDAKSDLIVVKRVALKMDLTKA